jgi:hypothetical protein
VIETIHNHVFGLLRVLRLGAEGSAEDIRPNALKHGSLRFVVWVEVSIERCEGRTPVTIAIIIKAVPFRTHVPDSIQNASAARGHARDEWRMRIRLRQFKDIVSRLIPIKVLNLLV